MGLCLTTCGVCNSTAEESVAKDTTAAVVEPTTTTQAPTTESTTTTEAAPTTKSTTTKVATTTSANTKSTTTALVVESTAITEATEDAEGEGSKIKGPCVDKVATCDRWQPSCDRSKAITTLCPKTCGVCTVDEDKEELPVESTTTEAPVTEPTTTEAPVTESTTTEAPVTESTTTEALVTETTTIKSASECVDYYQGCAKVANHCTSESYVGNLKKYCAYTCNIDNCRNLIQ